MGRERGRTARHDLGHAEHAADLDRRLEALDEANEFFTGALGPADTFRLVANRIKGVIAGPMGSFADALITGERAQIPRAMNDSLQASGLFHILSISGLHMAMVAGSTFWLVRALLALSPSLGLRWPIKKWSAAVALMVGFFYMLLADGGAATERSFIMIAVMFFAVMVDRPAISLHNLAVAAVFILVLSPEQAVAASFQMSFLAVMGLAAFFEWWNHRVENHVAPPGGWLLRLGRRFALLLVASLATSVIAGALSGIPAAHHFGRLAPYGVVANALALPVVSVAVMPMALLATLAMPFGWEALPLFIMEQGLRLVMVISDWVAGWPAAGATVPLLSSSTAASLAFAAAFATTARSALRWLSLPAVAVALWTGAVMEPPDVLVEERARLVAAIAPDGMLVPTPGKGSRFVMGKWLQQRGQQEKPAAAAKRQLWTCEASLCRATVKGRVVVFLKDTAEPLKPCPSADVVIAQYPLRRRCKGRLATIDRFDVWRAGAHGISFSGPDALVSTVRAEQGTRPWTTRPRPRVKQ
ncbi:MAG: ComEC/Rec2 family competence protein [Phyllobacteriaceae bacterium]|nr:ComEC/Rec2 family competence protein [Phyllobacteriaceae bacterium]